MEHIQVRYITLHPEAKPPVYNHGFLEDAGADLHSVERVVVHAGSGQLVRTGLAIELPPGYEGQVRTRSGMAKQGLVVANSPGTIDPSYRGEIGVIMWNLSKTDKLIEAGDRIAQLVVARYAGCEFHPADSLSESERGAGGFGSTGR
mgnify:CR=1 FL=1